MPVIPTLLTTTLDEFQSQMLLFQKYFQRIQIDIGDGQLVANKTIQISDIQHLLSEKKIELAPNVIFDFHLMVKNYEFALEEISKVIESGMKVNCVLINASLEPQIARLTHGYSYFLGLDVFPSESIEQIGKTYDLVEIPSIQIMTVQPGFQGSPFLPEMLTKLDQLRDQGYRGELMIDGGVNNETIPIITKRTVPPDYVCIGSYLTQAGNDLNRRLSYLKAL